MSKIADEIRKNIACHQFGDEHYGRWGILTFEQRRLIKQLTETCNMFERAADDFGKENYKLKDQLALTEKALELACEEINRVEAKFGSAYIRANGYLVDYFKTKAKEIKSE